MPGMSQRSPCLWTQLPQNSKSPCDRHKHACCTYDGNVYVLGGRDNHSLRDLWRYRVVCNEWTQLDCTSDAAPEELEEHSMVAHEGLLYVFGGMLDSAYTKWRCPLWVFDIVKQKWLIFQAKMGCQQSCMPTNRKGHSAVVVGGAMLVYGGFIDMRGSSQEFWKLDLNTLAWSPLDGSQQGSQGPGPRHGHTAAAHQDCMFLFGGLKGLREQRDFWSWNSSGRAWSCLKSRSGPSRLVGHSAVAYKDSMLLFGGGESQNSPENFLWRYSFAAHTWEQMATLAGSNPPPRMHHCSVGVGAGYEPDAGTTTGSELRPRRLEDRLRPFKNKCFPAPLTFLGSEVAIELETFSLERSDSKEGLIGKDAKTSDQHVRQRIRNCLTFENKAFSAQWSCEEEEELFGEEEEEDRDMAQHLPDVLLVLGGKPRAGQTPISMWQMTLTDT
ncbi:host cell factor [Genypterus blacodes]|uniref:host cell factor n=1 Tax=Genypterus blacodes TaxID=154954 RepID=UPI003F76DE34